MTSPKEKLTKSERKQRNQMRLIIESARKLFEEKSYEDVSMEEIADEAAVSKQTLYNYFSSKDSIYLGIGTEGFREALERTDEIKSASLTGKDLVLKLCEIFFNTAIYFPLNAEISRRFSTMNDEMGGIANQILLKRAEEESRIIERKVSIENALADYLEHVQKYENRWTTAIQEGKTDGSISSNLSIEQLMYYTYILITGIVDQLQLKKEPIMKALKNANLNYERIREITLRIMENLLENEM